LRWPTPTPPDLPPPFAVADYAGPTRSLLLAYKEDGVVGLQSVLGPALAESVVAATAGQSRGLILVPVPSSRAARRARGDDVVARLARRAARVLRARRYEIRVVKALTHTRRVADSAGLTSAERSTNLARAFRVRGGALAALTGRPVILVDDLVTTGATLAECTRTLRTGGVVVHAAATVAATRRDLSIARGGLHNARAGHYGAW
jgi:predicted amidophosphoribosyltransferase